jgi:hypothetical protein
VGDREHRVAPEDAAGEFGLVRFEGERVDEVVACGRDGGVVLVGQFAGEQRVDTGTLLDQGEEVRPLDGDVALADSVPETVVGD